MLRRDIMRWQQTDRGGKQLPLASAPIHRRPVNKRPKDPGSGALIADASSASPSGSTSRRRLSCVLNPPRRFISELLNEEAAVEAVVFMESAQAGAVTNRSAADTIRVDFRFMKFPRVGLSKRGATS